MDRLAHALPGNCSPQQPQQLQHASNTSDLLQSDLRRDRASGSDGFHSLAESARARHVVAEVDDWRLGPDAPDRLHFSRSARDHTMGSHERRNEVEPTRGRRTPASTDNVHQGGRARPTQEVDLFSSRARSSRSRSPMKRSRSPDKATAVPRSMTADSRLGEHRHKPCPAAIDVNTARQYGAVSKKAIVIEVPSQHQSQQAAFPPPNTPPTSLRRVRQTMTSSISDSGDDEGSSYYSEEDFGQAQPSYVSPLRVRKGVDSDNNVLLRSYSTRAKSPSPDRYPRSPQREGRHCLQDIATTGEFVQQEPVPMLRNYSPLSDYLSSRMPVKRKEMVGKHGWLERTKSPDKVPDLEKKDAAQHRQHQQKRGFLNNLKKLAKDLTSDITASASRNKLREKGPQASRLTVSLDPREQSLLYCELEFLLTTALDSYINSQFNAGRLDADKYKKIVDGWLQRGRPKVIGFRYDLETQLDLVLLHNEDFRFYGKRAGLIAAVNGVLGMMHVDARAMRIRTFCQPDTVVAKQLLDAQSLFNLIGCCEQQQIRLAEVIQFFKVILEREQNYRRREDGNRLDDSEKQWRGGGGTGTDPQPKKSDSSKNSSSVPDYSSF